MNLSRELMQLCLGTRHELSAVPSDGDWEAAFDFSTRQTTVPLPDYVCRILPQEFRPGEDLMQKFRTASQANAIKASGLESAADAFLEYLAGKGFPACVLKGRSLAAYWPDPDARQCGDIDVWVGGGRDDVIAALSKDYELHDILWQECHLQTGAGVTVDVHFYPTKAANPLYRRRLIRYYDGQLPLQTAQATKTAQAGPSLDFNLVYCMAHIYRHALRGGVNFRQVMDYAFLLKASSENQRRAAYRRIRSLGMARVAADLMFVMSATLGLPDDLLLCGPSERGGRKMVKDALEFRAGFHGPRTLRGELAMFLRYPGEVFWTPASRLGQYVWRHCRKYA